MSNTFLKEVHALAAYCGEQNRVFGDQAAKRVRERIALDLDLIFSDTHRFLGRLRFPYDLEYFHFVGPNSRTKLKKPYAQTFFFEMKGGPGFSEHTDNILTLEWSALELSDMRVAYPRENQICAEIDLATAHLSQSIEFHNVETANILAEQMMQALKRVKNGQAQFRSNGSDPSYIWGR